MMHAKKWLAAAVLTMLFSGISHACFWDYDTIEMERQQFPTVIELITGKFLRHSPEFYYWRVNDRSQKLKQWPDSLPLYDDLAVAWSKLGDNGKAIDLMYRKDSIRSGMYETYANLGTFYLHDGQLEKGLEFIRKAIEINPDAHFGREIYQQRLVEYLMSKRKADGKFPLPMVKSETDCFECPPDPSPNFYYYLLDIHNQGKQKKANQLPDEALQAAVNGILGMMKFGDHGSPVLLEALGDLLMGSGWNEGARQLASRAYLKASYAVEDEQAKELYRKKVVIALGVQYTSKNGYRFSMKDLETLFAEELKEGEAFYEKIRQDEWRWISEGKNPEEEFQQEYYEDPALSDRKQPKGANPEVIYLEKDFPVTLVDVRPALNRPETLPPQNMRLIDSLFTAAAAVKEDPAASGDTAPPAEADENSSFPWIWFGGAIILLLMWLMIRSRKR